MTLFSSATQIIQVALPVPLGDLFDYLPVSGQELPHPGSRVLVPFGRRKMVGMVMAITDSTDQPQERLLPVIGYLDQGQALVDHCLLALMKWCAWYYKHSPGTVVMSSLPPLLRQAAHSLPASPVVYTITAAGQERLDQGPGRAKQQWAMLDQIAQEPRTEDQLRAAFKSWTQFLKPLLEQAWVKKELAQPACLNPVDGPKLTEEQQQALTNIQAAGQGFSSHLLDGVTGSGKTEIYLQLAIDQMRAGRQVLLLVPEIGLTPQLIQRFRQRTGMEPAVLHSGLSEGARLNAWAQARSGHARLIIGTRSALFLPLPDLGLLILDEEHDASFKQQEGFRYSARDVAVKRASELDIPVILGSATPSLESLHNAMTQRYHWHQLRQRATGASMPAWRVQDTGQLPIRQGLTEKSLEEIESRIARGEQVLVFLNRRGFAPVLMCQQCDWHAECSRCDSNLTWHKSIRLLQCHHCGQQKRVPQLCPECGADALYGVGEGTEQLTEFLENRFGQVPVLRFDRDSVRRKGAFEQLSNEVLTGKPCVVVGTQMLAKGHHFPRMTLVVVVNLDQALYSADFRALERMAQLLIQVSGRAGRDQRPGEVLLQTAHPDHPLLMELLDKGYEHFARSLLEERSQAGLPPYRFQCLLRAEAHQRSLVEEFLQQAKDILVKQMGVVQVEGEVFGPIPALMERRGGRSRMYVLVQSGRRAQLHHQLDHWLPAIRQLPLSRKVRWVMDVDPQEL